MQMKLIADTNAILALLDRQDPNHQAARAVLPAPLVLPSLVLPEIDYLAGVPNLD
jgi:predicted nucleic acid-binding protein